MKRFFAIIICLAAIVGVISAAVSAADGDYDGVYVVFGDSIAAGYGLSGAPIGTEESYNYVAGRDSNAYAGIVARALGYDLSNFAHSGDRTADMLGVISRGGVLDEVAKADLVTVSIGGNDLIAMTATVLPRAAMHEALSSYIDIPMTDESIEAMYQTLEENLTAIMSALVGANGGRGVIMLQTLYNPFKFNRSYTVSFSGYEYNMGDLIDYYIARINEIYARVRDKVGGFVLVDTAAALNADSRSFYEITTPDFHPTAFGHALIAETILAAYGGGSQTESTTSVSTTEATTVATTTETTTVATTTETTTVATTTEATTVATTTETTTVATTTEATTVATTTKTTTVATTTETTTVATTTEEKPKDGCSSFVGGTVAIVSSLAIICAAALRKKEEK